MIGLSKILGLILHPFRWLRRDMPLKGKVIIAVLMLCILVGGGIGAFKLYDFTQNNPKFCVSCHLMQPAFDEWAKGAHNKINCHECHILSIIEQNRLLVNFILHSPESVPKRHGKTIVPWKLCITCHWEKDERYPGAPKINRSQLHAKHVFIENQECTACHSYIAHKFLPEARFCVKCHQGKTVHGIGMEELACLNCHTDMTKDLRPERNKCLFCHGDETVRESLIKNKTIDIKYFTPRKEVVEKAVKIDIPKDAPMQFFCYECHKPHETVRPDWGHCLDCHKIITEVGKHNLHIKVVGMKCKDCHKPHSWRVTIEGAKKDCVKCHEYRDPMKFIRS